MSTQPRWTRDWVKQRLAMEPGQTAAQGVSSLLDPYLESAAVLAYFDPSQLRPSNGSKDPAPADLLSYIESTLDSSGKPQFTLRTDVRRTTLTRLIHTNTWQKALAAAPILPDCAVQTVLTNALQGILEPLEKLSLQELWALVDVRDWLSLAHPALVDLPTLQRCIAQEELLQPLRQRTRLFAGRAQELNFLRERVGVRRVTHGTSTTTEFSPTPITRMDELPPLHIWGIGGLGKSTLISQFVLEHLDVPENERFPFVYIDFDRPGLDVSRPLTLIRETLRQLAILAPSLESNLAPIQDRAGRFLDQEVDANTQRSITLELLSPLRSALSPLYPLDRPFVLVLDTFERVQYKHGPALHTLWDFFNDLQYLFPTLRVLIAGRNPLPSEFVHTPYPLPILDEQAAIAVLFSSNVKDVSIAQRVYQTVGGNPLCLRLAAAVVAREGDFSLQVQEQIDAEQIQGVLYNRILGHLKTPESQAIAHPGMVLRFITPDLIYKVLAKPCGVNVPSLEAAEALYNELRREAELVTEDGPVLRHRADVRRAMLTLIRKDEHKKDGGARLRTIHQAAIDYYTSPSTQNLTEALYHHLCLDHPAADLTSFAKPEITAPLVDVRGELPPRANAWLGVELGHAIEPDLRAVAEQSVWESDTARRVEKLFKSGTEADLHTALQLLGERSERSDRGYLHAFEAEVYLRADEPDKAALAADRALIAAEQEQNPDLLMVAHGAQGRVAQVRGDVIGALSAYGSAAEVARSASAFEAYFTFALRQVALCNEIALAHERAAVVLQMAEVERSLKVDLPTALREQVRLAIEAQNASNLVDSAPIDLRLLAGAITNQFPTLDTFADFLRYELEVPLGSIQSSTVLAEAARDTVSYFASQNRLIDLVNALVQRAPQNTDFRNMLALLRGFDVPLPENPNGYLTDQQIEKVWRAAIYADLDPEALLAGLPSAYVTSLPTADTKGALIRKQLRQINVDGPLPNDAGATVLPIQTWLQNGLGLSKHSDATQMLLEVSEKVFPSSKAPTVGDEPRRIYLLYSFQDQEYRNALVAHFAALVAQRRLVIDDPSTLLPGVNVEAETTRLLEHADVVIALLSADLLANNQIMDRVHNVLDQGRRIIPVLIRPCYLSGSPFDRLQRLPLDDEPVGSPKNDEAWAKIVEKVWEDVQATFERKAAKPPSQRNGDALDKSLSAIANAFVRIFQSRGRFYRFVASQLSFSLDALLPPNLSHSETVDRFVAWAEKEGHLPDLLAAALDQTSGDDQLRAATFTYLLQTDLPISASATQRLNSRLLRAARVGNPNEWSTAMWASAQCVCRLTSPTPTNAAVAGFLVGPATILTTHDAFTSLLTHGGRAVFPPLRLNNVEGVSPFVADIASNALLAHSDVQDLNYALIQIRTKVPPQEQLRGFLILSNRIAIPGDDLFTFFPSTNLRPDVSVSTLRLEARSHVGDPGRITYPSLQTQSLPGSPVFAVDRQLLALFERSVAGTNYAVSMPAILTDLKAKNLLHLLGRSPTAGGN
ncbi:MAG: hypothetical protein IPK82_24725 [Polyangiaceae bacterium]|nr:hypothetical protein [Polyangiaceae bacterium]